MSYSVTVTRVNEGAHEDAEKTYNDVTSVNVSDDGGLSITREEGRANRFGATTWGSVTVVRVTGR